MRIRRAISHSHMTYSETVPSWFLLNVKVVLLTKVLTTVKDGLIRYNNTKTSRNGVNSMWIVKNFTSLLSSLDQLDVRTATSVQTYDFSTLYTSIPHKLRLKLLHLYTTHSRGEMEVTDIPTSKLQVERGIS